MKNLFRQVFVYAKEANTYNIDQWVKNINQFLMFECEGLSKKLFFKRSEFTLGIIVTFI